MTAVGWPVTTPREFVKLVNCSSKFDGEALRAEAADERELSASTSEEETPARSVCAKAATARTGRMIEERIMTEVEELKDCSSVS